MRCVYCDKVMNTGPQPQRPHGVKKSTFRPVVAAWCADVATRDHIVAQSRGGRAWVYACGACNSAKHDLSLFEWRVLLSIRRRTIVVYAYEWVAIRAFVRDVLCTLALVRLA